MGMPKQLRRTVLSGLLALVLLAALAAGSAIRDRWPVEHSNPILEDMRGKLGQSGVARGSDTLSYATFSRRCDLLQYTVDGPWGRIETTVAAMPDGTDVLPAGKPLSGPRSNNCGFVILGEGFGGRCTWFAAPYIYFPNYTVWQRNPPFEPVFYYIDHIVDPGSAGHYGYIGFADSGGYPYGFKIKELGRYAAHAPYASVFRMDDGRFVLFANRGNAAVESVFTPDDPDGFGEGMDGLSEVLEIGTAGWEAMGLWPDPPGDRLEVGS